MPRIAIPVPTSNDPEYNQRNWKAYALSVEAAGGEAVEVALKLPPDELESLATSCQGVLLPGSPADVDPTRYGQEVDPASSPADAARESVDLYLLQHAAKTRKPVLGICFGCQILNVFHGGTLLQDLAIMPVNHPSARGVVVAHTAQVAPQSLLGGIVDIAEAPETDGFLRLPVNSSHHQAVGITGQGLHVSARCPQDSVVEAIEGPDPVEHFVLGVQWHPERTTAESASSRAIFARLLHEATVWELLAR